MNRYLLLFWLGMYLFANPIAEVIINEFEVTPSDSERIEFRYFRSASNDTIYSDSFSLLNLHLYTPAGVSFIDTQVYLPGMGYRVIDASFLSGNFGLPDDSGFIKVDSGGFISLYDSVPYPQLAPTPPINCSAANFIFITGIWEDIILSVIGTLIQPQHLVLIMMIIQDVSSVEMSLLLMVHRLRMQRLLRLRGITHISSTHLHIIKPAPPILI